MTLAAQSLKAGKDLAWLLEVEVAKRVDDLVWAAAGSDAYYITPAEGEPERVREIDVVLHTVTQYAEQSTLAGCQGDPGSWYFDAATGRLYVHTTLGTAPASGDFYLAAYYWRRYCDGQREAPCELVFNGHWYDPRLVADSIPDFSMEVAPFQEGGVRQTWGSMKLANGDGALDQDLVDYFWENKVFVLRVGQPGDDYADFVTVSSGRTGSVVWDEREVTIGVLDPLRAED